MNDDDDDDDEDDADADADDDVWVMLMYEWWCALTPAAGNASTQEMSRCELQPGEAGGKDLFDLLQPLRVESTIEQVW